MTRVFHPLGKVVLWLSGALAVLLAGLAGWIFWDLPEVAGLKDRRATHTIEVRDWQGGSHPFRLGPANPFWTPLEDFPAELKWAVIAAEDANFYEHQGVDLPALKEALKYDLQQKRLARGASTITQQVAKNVLLSRDKSLRRKLRELVLAGRMERELSKGRILELYLNVVELGPLVYGAGQGARHLFDKPVTQLSPAECAVVAAILPGPRVAYNPQTRPVKVRRRAAHILHLLELRGVLGAAEAAAATRELEPVAPSPPPELDGVVSPDEPASDAASPPAADSVTPPASAPASEAPATSPESPPESAPPGEVPGAIPGPPPAAE